MRVGHLGDVGHQEVHERRVEQLAGLVVGHPLVERAADALRDAAVDLALDDHRVDQVAAVVDDGVLEDRDLGGLRVGLDDHGVHAGGERRALGRVEVLALQARLVVLGHRRLARVADRELGGRLGRLVEGVAQRVGQHRDRAEVDRRCRARPSPTRRRRRSRGRPRSASSASAAIRSAFSLARLAARWIGRAAHHRGARGERADGVRHPAGVAGDHLDVLERHAELVGDDLGERPSRGPGPGWSGRSRP